jgi:hypothetical protein
MGCRNRPCGMMGGNFHVVRRLFLSAAQRNKRNDISALHKTENSPTYVTNITNIA